LVRPREVDPLLRRERHGHGAQEPREAGEYSSRTFVRRRSAAPAAASPTVGAGAGACDGDWEKSRRRGGLVIGSLVLA
jgi:hypothetical protein